MDKKIQLSQLLPFIEAAFEKGTTFKIPITGTSMLPLLVQGRDFVILQKPQLPLNPGDIPLYRRADGSFVLHRVMRIENNTYTMSGDNQFLLEKGITDADIIGVVCKIIRDGKEIPVTDSEYVKYKNRYVKNFGTRYPIRRLKYNLYRLKNGKH